MMEKNFRISGDLKVTNEVMNNSFWVGVHPGLTKVMLDYIVDRFETFFGLNF